MKRYLILSFITVLALLAYGETLNVTMNLEPGKVELVRHKEYTYVRYADRDAFSIARPGTPDLPAMRLRVLIPSDKDIGRLSISMANPMSLGPMVPYPCQGHRILSQGEKAFVPPDMTSYYAKRIVPAANLRARGYSLARGFKLAHLACVPFEFHSDTRTVYFFRTITVQVELVDAAESTRNYPTRPAYTRLIQAAVINPGDMARFYPTAQTAAPTDSLDMLIITTDTFATAAATYADFRAQQGITSAIKTVSQITSEYPGSSTQLKIKHCVEDYLINHNILYAFLIGDAGNSGTYSVPDQNTYVNLDWVPTADDTIPADNFYACFDGQYDWNADGDNRVGEMDVDGADVSPEVFIGRLPIRQITAISDYQAKVQDYLDAATDENFIKDLLLVAITLADPGDSMDESELMHEEYIAPFWQDHNKHTLYDMEDDVTESAVSQALEEDQHFMHMATHGNVTVWSMEGWGSFGTSDAFNLYNIPNVIATIACNTNAYDPEIWGATDPCLSEAFTRNTHGGTIVYVGCSRYGIGNGILPLKVEMGPSMHYDARYFKYVLKDESAHVSGAALGMAKIELTGEANTDCSFRWLNFGINHTGDPSLALHIPSTVRPIHRFFNTVSGGHFFTASDVEYQYVLNNLPHYTYEGVKFQIYPNAQSTTVPVHRFFNTRTGGHFFTASTIEYEYVLNHLPHYTYEGVKFHVYREEQSNTLPVYRFFNTRLGGHFFTTSTVERDYIMNHVTHLTYEGVKFHVMP